MKSFSRLFSIFRFINNHPLAGRHKILSYKKFLQWQISQFLSPGEKKISFVGPTFLLAKKGTEGATGNIYTGLHEFADMGFLLHFLRENDLFADIGANIGSYTILASGYVGSKTISFEPLPETFKSLQKNIKLNNIEQHVTAYNMGISSGKNKLLFTSSHDSANHVIADFEKDTTQPVMEVEVTSLDEILKGQDIIPLLVKIDVEGFETEVLNGMSGILKNQNLKAIIIELNGSGNRYGYDENQIHKLLLTEGFRTYAYDPIRRLLQELSSFGTLNTLYLRDLKFVNDRTKNAKKVLLFSESF